VTQATRRRRARTSSLLVLALCLALVGGGAAWGADDPTNGPVAVTVQVPEATNVLPDDTGLKVTNAELKWGINLETRGRTYFGACNFAMAGWPGQDGNAKNATPWEQRGGGLYHATSGNVSVVNAKGAAVPFTGRCNDPAGKALQSEPTATFTDHQIRLTKGTGQVDTATGQGQISWQGTVTVVFYDGLVYFWLRNPVLNLGKGGTANLTATVGGYGSDRNDATKWVPFKERTVVVAQGKAALQAAGAELNPDYKDVALPLVKDQALGRLSTNPGAWPAGFVDFQTTTGLSQYWYSTGNNHDYRKPPDPLYISWDANKSIAPPPPDGSGRPPAGAGESDGFPPADGTPTSGGSGGQGAGAGGGTPSGTGEATAQSPWDMVVEPAEFNAAGQELVPNAKANQRGRSLLVEIALLTLICTSGLGLVGWRRGWFKSKLKGQPL